MPCALPPIRVLIADDSDTIRSRIAGFLRHYFDVAAVGEARTVDEAFRLATGEPWDLILLDAAFPVCRGIAVLRALRAAGNRVPVIIVSGTPEAQLRGPMLAAGANAFVQKERVPEELRRLVRSILPAHLLPGVAS